MDKPDKTLFSGRPLLNSDEIDAFENDHRLPFPVRNRLGENHLLFSIF